MESVESTGVGTEWRVTVAVERHLWTVLEEYEGEVVGEWVGVVFIGRGRRVYEVMIERSHGVRIIYHLVYRLQSPGRSVIFMRTVSCRDETAHII